MELLAVFFLGAGIGWYTDKPATVVDRPVPCRIVAPERPAFDYDTVPADASILEFNQSLHVDRIQRRQYEAELEAAVKACQ